MTATWRASGSLRLFLVSTLALATVLLFVSGSLRLDTTQIRLTMDPVLLWMALAAGLVLIVGGALSAASGYLWRTGRYAGLAGVAWLGPGFARLTLEGSLVRSVAALSAVLVLPLVIHALLALSPSISQRVPVRPVLYVIDVSAVAVLVAWTSMAPTVYDPACPEACLFMTTIGGPAVLGHELIRNGSQVVTLAAGALLVFTAAVAWRIERPQAAPRSALLAAAILVGIAAAVFTALTVLRTTIGTDRTVIEGLRLAFAVWSAGLVVVGLGLCLEVGRLRGARDRIRHMAEHLTAAATLGSMATELTTALSDATLRIGYPIGDVRTCVDAAGDPIEVVPASGRTVTVLQRRGQSIAVVDHRDDIDGRVLTEAFRPSLLVALDNERLRAVRLAQLSDLRASRIRIVEVGDAERRRVERDLHDGAQQRLLAVAFDLRLARLAAERDGRSQAALRYADAEARALASVEDLRRLCQGIHPQVLSLAGLGPALESLADEADIPLDVVFDVAVRPALAVETAAYEVITDALAQAVSRGARALCLHVVDDHDSLLVETNDGVMAPLTVRPNLGDRVGALGGTLTAGMSDEGGFLRGVLPCA